MITAKRNSSITLNLFTTQVEILFDFRRPMACKVQKRKLNNRPHAKPRSINAKYDENRGQRDAG